MLKVPLAESFRYVHEPLRADEQALPLLGNHALIEELKHRLRRSRGGTFLITGFRGVGKSTIVVRALDEIAAEGDPAGLIVPIMLNVARPTTPERLLFAVVRRVYEALQDRGALPELSEAAQRALMLAHIRTSLGVKQTQGDATERNASLTLGVGDAVRRLAGPAGFVVPAAGLSSKRTRSLATEASFLTYSDADVEYDLARIVDLLDGRGPAGPPARRRLFGRRPVRRFPRVHLVVVLDEVDKLTAASDGLAAVEELLTSLKNTLTMRGVHFLVVAGPDLHDNAVRDVSRGNSVYESVFAWRMYVPCTWDAPERLVRAMVGEPPPGTAEDVARLVRYLRFKARGVPRRLLQEFGDLVVWEGPRPFLVAAGADYDRMVFYARLEELADRYFRQPGQERLFPVPIDEDRWRLGGYYILDWILRSEGEPFTSLSIVGSPERAELDPLLRIAQPAVERLLRHLAGQGVITVLREPGVNATLVGGDDYAQQLTSYKLAEDVKRTLLGIAFGSEAERAALDLAAPPVAVSQTGFVSGAPPWGAGEAYPSYQPAWDRPGTYPAQPVQPAPPQPSPAGADPPHMRRIADRYDLLEVIGQGGMSTVYRGYDTQLGRIVAVKVMRGDRAGSEDLARRFRRESRIATRLRHPGIVTTYDVVDDPVAGLAMVMELVEGRTLREVVAADGPLPLPEAVRLARTLASTLAYLEGENLTRLDLKPDNVMIAPGRDPVVIDFGIVKGLVDSTVATDIGMIVGTPAYIAPEAVRGGRVDTRSDIYTFGIVLHFALTGRVPYPTDSVQSVLLAIAEGRLDLSGLDGVPEPLAAVVRRATALSPDERYQSPQELIEGLDEAAQALDLEDAAPGDDESGGGAGADEGWEEPPTVQVPVRSPAGSGGNGRGPRAEEAGGDGAAPLVYGMLCPQGHFNDPRLPDCAVCGVAMVGGVWVRQARPPLGVLLVDDGQVLPLDRPYLVGRRPETAPEVEDGSAVPVPVDDREQSVSRRHLLVDMDGWDVVVVDLGSTNGTALLTPSAPGFAELPPESPVVLPPGAVIRVGLSRTLRFEPHRPAP
ncbi:protein kinase [Nonomuraea sp. NPDC050691]|uniref:protein kinase domain-containing protein n=1 Tax=Nonomuraea sp. NPDC050691 TaxID=3155661 RepID=UPI0033D6B05A